MIAEILIAVLIAYLIGSISLGYFFGRVVKGVDIRKYGNKNTGATNTYRIVGRDYGIITGVFDFLKSSIVFFLAYSYFNAVWVALLISIFVVIGHNYPFYLGFRGGKGVASLWGILLISIFYSRGLIVFLFFIFVLGYTLIVSRRLKIQRPWRKIYRILGFIFPLVYLFYGQKTAFYVVAIAALLLLVFDILRLMKRKLNIWLFRKLKMFFKEKEKRFLSTTTLFLISSCLIIWFFPLEIAFISIAFFLIGDSFAEIFGRAFPYWKVNGKSFVGWLSGLAGNLFFGLFLIGFLDVGAMLIVKAAFFSMMIEFLSMKIDDNFTMPLGTALLLGILR